MFAEYSVLTSREGEAERCQDDCWRSVGERSEGGPCGWTRLRRRAGQELRPAARARETGSEGSLLGRRAPLRELSGGEMPLRGGEGWKCRVGDGEVEGLAGKVGAPDRKRKAGRLQDAWAGREGDRCERRPRLKRRWQGGHEGGTSDHLLLEGRRRGAGRRATERKCEGVEEKFRDEARQTERDSRGWGRGKRDEIESRWGVL